MRELKVGGIYKHFKGDMYIVHGVALDSETKRPMVIYQALYGEGTVYVRDQEMFLSEVDREKYPQVEQTYRFELQNIDSVASKFNTR